MRSLEYDSLPKLKLFQRPVLNSGYDYVSPYYHRHKYDGTITNTIVYPITRALYGKRIRQLVWKETKGSSPVETFGFVYAVGLEPISVNLDRMIEKCKLDVNELAPSVYIWPGGGMGSQESRPQVYPAR